jgi:hypothetical protein
MEWSPGAKVSCENTEQVDRGRFWSLGLRDDNVYLDDNLLFKRLKNVRAPTVKASDKVSH